MEVVCPITLQPIRDPVILESGVTFEREAIKRWLLTSNTCPSTRISLLPVTMLVPNRSVGAPSKPNAEPFVCGPLNGLLLGTYIAMARTAPNVFEGLKNRLEVSAYIGEWTIRDASVALPSLAAVLRLHPDGTGVFQALFDSFAGSVMASPPGANAIHALRILADSVLNCAGLNPMWARWAHCLAHHGIIVGEKGGDCV